MSLTSKYPDVAERLINQAHREDKNIKDFGDFFNAIKSYLGETQKGENLLGFVDDADLKEMFESRENRHLMKENLSEEDYKEVFKSTDDEVQGDVDYSVFRKKLKGMKTAKQDILLIRTPKQIQVKGYKNTTGRETHFYVKGYSKWTINENTYLKGLKEKGIPYNQALVQYRARFRTSERTQSSLKSKFYRL